MISTDILVICCIVMLTLVVGGLGYLLGKINSISVSQHNPQSFFKKNNTSTNTVEQSNISIDNKKFVTSISTDGMVKKYDALGDTKKSEENISESVNKLKNLKR